MRCQLYVGSIYTVKKKFYFKLFISRKLFWASTEEVAAQ